MRHEFSDDLVQRLATARRVAVLTGAGISAESGVPTFRDLDGLWQRFRPEELANVDAFLRNPILVQGWYRHRQEILTKVEPNPGHDALAALEDLVSSREGGSFLLATQNVDNLHQRAGSRRVVELHGNLTRSYCIGCGRTANEDDLIASIKGEEIRCGDCRELIRPDVVWFGEMLPQEAMTSAMEAASNADVFLSIGTSAVVYPAAGIPLIAADAGAYVVEVNVERSAIADAMDEVVIGPSGEVLPRLIDAVRDHAAAHGGVRSRR